MCRYCNAKHFRNAPISKKNSYFLMFYKCFIKILNTTGFHIFRQIPSSLDTLYVKILFLATDQDFQEGYHAGN